MGDLIEGGHISPGFGEGLRKHTNHTRERPWGMIFCRFYFSMAVVAYKSVDISFYIPAYQMILYMLMNIPLLYYNCLNKDIRVYQLTGIIVLVVDSYLLWYTSLLFTITLGIDCLFVYSVYKLQREG
jgi:hypothetical protein